MSPGHPSQALNTNSNTFLLTWLATHMDSTLPPPTVTYSVAMSTVDVSVHLLHDVRNRGMLIVGAVVLFPFPSLTTLPPILVPPLKPKEPCR